MGWLEQILLNIAVLFADVSCCAKRPSFPPPRPQRAPFNSPVPSQEPIFYYVPSISDDDSYDEREMIELLADQEDAESDAETDTTPDHSMDDDIGGFEFVD